MSCVARIVEPVEITPNDLWDAYLICKLRQLGYSFQRAIDTPHIYKSLRGTALAKKLHPKAAPAAPQQTLELEIA